MGITYVKAKPELRAWLDAFGRELVKRGDLDMDAVSLAAVGLLKRMKGTFKPTAVAAVLALALQACVEVEGGSDGKTA